MNYYERHLGDYARDARHLTMVEHGAYTLMLDRYYTTERALPADLGELCRVVGARTREERQAVEVVLREFFVQAADGWHQKRADEELARYRDKQDKARRSAQARWGAMPPQSERNANASLPTPPAPPPDKDADAMRTHSEGNALQSPVTSNQSPDRNTDPEALQPTGDKTLGAQVGTQDPPPGPAKADKADKADKVKAQAPKPDDVSEQTWEGFLVLRRAKKAPLTPAALAQFTREAKKAGVSVEQAMLDCCARGWAGFKASWPSVAASDGPPKAPETFYERTERLKRQRYAEMVGEHADPLWPNGQPGGTVIDMADLAGVDPARIGNGGTA